MHHGMPYRATPRHRGTLVNIYQTLLDACSLHLQTVSNGDAEMRKKCPRPWSGCRATDADLWVPSGSPEPAVQHLKCTYLIRIPALSLRAASPLILPPAARLYHLSHPQSPQTCCSCSHNQQLQTSAPTSSPGDAFLLLLLFLCRAHLESEIKPASGRLRARRRLQTL